MAQRHAGATIPTLWSECQGIWSLLVPGGTVRSVSFRETGLWRDVREGPAALATTVDAAAGIPQAAGLLRADGVRRIVAVGNGAAYYVAHALWLAALESRRRRAAARRGPLRRRGRGRVPLADGRRRPRGLLVGRVPRRRRGRRTRRGRRPPMRRGHRRRDLLARPAPRPRPCSSTSSTSARSPTRRRSGAATPRRSALWAARDRTTPTCGAVVAAAPAAAARAVAAADAWADEALGDVRRPGAAVVVGGGAAWAGALEAALMLKEIARRPGRGRRDARGRDVGDVRPRPRPPHGEPRPAGRRRRATRRCACARRPGAATLRLPGVADADPRLALVTPLPGRGRAGRRARPARADTTSTSPTWTDAYYATARSAP